MESLSRVTAFLIASVRAIGNADSGIVNRVDSVMVILDVQETLTQNPVRLSSN